MTIFRAATRPAAALVAVLACVLLLLLAACAGGSGSSGPGATGAPAGARSAASSAASSARSAASRAVRSAVSSAGQRAASATSGAGSSAVIPTVVHTVTPWSASGTLTVASTAAVAGSCFTTSLAAPSPRTYRCFHGNTLLDPCFLSPTSTHTVACLASPWATAQVLTLSSAPPAPIRTGSGRFWALTLADGARCVADTGTVPEVAGVNLSYTCSDGTHAEPVNPSAAQLVVQRARLGATAVTRIAVSAAWRA